MANEYGFLLHNPAGDVLIDGEHIHPRLYHEMTVSLPAAATTSGNKDLTFTFPATDRPIFPVWHCTGGSMLVREVLRDGSGRYNRLVVARPQRGQGNITATIRIYIIPELQTPSSGTERHGIEAWNKDGKMVYSSDWETLSVLDQGYANLPLPFFQTAPYEGVTVNFAPQAEPPFVYLSGVGQNQTYYNWDRNETYAFLPFAGRFEKNGNGLWHRMKLEPGDWYWRAGDHDVWYFGLGAHYVIFS